MIASNISQRLRAQLLVALGQHDWDAVDDLIGDAADELGGDQQAMDLFRSQLLPQASIETRRQFWQHAMTPEQYSSFLEHMVETVVMRLEAADYLLGQDFSVGPGAVYLKPLPMELLQSFYTPGQFASLSLILQCIQPSTNDTPESSESTPLESE